MREVFDAIYLHYQNDSALVAALPGGFYFSEAPQKSRNVPIVYPHAVYFPTAVFSSNTFTEEEETFYFDIMVFAKSFAEVETALVALRGTISPVKGFDYALISPSGYEGSRMIRQRVVFQFQVENHVWHARVSYVLRLERSSTFRG